MTVVSSVQKFQEELYTLPLWLICSFLAEIQLCSKISVKLVSEYKTINPDFIYTRVMSFISFYERKKSANSLCGRAKAHNGTFCW